MQSDQISDQESVQRPEEMNLPRKGCSLYEKKGYPGNQQKGREEMAILRDSGHIKMEVIEGLF